MDIIEYIRERVQSNSYEISRHAERERESDHLLISDIEESIVLNDDTRVCGLFIVWWRSRFPAHPSYVSLGWPAVRIRRRTCGGMLAMR